MAAEDAVTALAITSYGFAAAAHAFLLVLLAATSRGPRPISWLMLAVGTTMLWAAAIAAVFVAGVPAPAWIIPLDALHAAAWLAFLAVLLSSGSRHALAPERILPLGALGVAAALGVAVLAGERLGPLAPSPQGTQLVLLLLSLAGLLATEQVYRNRDARKGQALGLVCVAVGGLFAYDLFVYSHAVLLRQVDVDLWLARGFANALIVPLIVLGAKRHPEWAEELYVSRQMAFYSAALVGMGLYLVAMAGGAYVIRMQGGEWGRALQAAFFAGALLLLGAVLFSASLRARAMVFLDKHFYRSRYDYRQEWLKLIQTLGRFEQPVVERCVDALAEILGGKGGRLWLRREGDGAFAAVPVRGAGSRGRSVFPVDHPLVAFLHLTGWVVDTAEYRSAPERYGYAFEDAAAAELPERSVIVPLFQDGGLLGMVAVEQPARLGALNYEDHDLLKTAGQQLSVFLAQDFAKEELARTRQFEAFNRLASFLMHDLKNIVSQQGTAVHNARRFRSEPRFIDDMIDTVEGGLLRMRKVLGQLQQRQLAADAGRVQVQALLAESIAEAAQRRQPAPVLELHTECEVWADRDRLGSAIAHAICNAQQATSANGQVAVSLRARDGWAEIAVRDTGCGMDEEFVRTRLFRPFDTTKGARGMGIGAYQVLEYVRGAGGHIEVNSALGEGTEFVIRLPLLAAPAASDSVQIAREEAVV